MSDSILVSGEEMRAAEQAAFSAGMAEEELMNEAGRGLAEVMAARFPRVRSLVIFAGKGHNAGDAFVAAEMLAEEGWRIEIRRAFPVEAFRPLALRKFRACEAAATEAEMEAPPPPGRFVMLDGVLGIGAGGALQGEVLDACRTMNRLRQERHAAVVALDVPTGVDCTTGACDPAAVLADLTVTFGFAKSGLVADGATRHVGRLELIPLAALRHPGGIRDFVVSALVAREWLPAKRSFEMHKGEAGRVGVVAGGRGCVGAARLAAAAAVRSGAGLVTLFVPEGIYDLAAASCIPEVMVRTMAEIGNVSVDAWGIGPGLGAQIQPALLGLLRNLSAPAVLDADALNWIAQSERDPDIFGIGPRLLTPHPGEMSRLLSVYGPEWRDLPRAAQAKNLAGILPVTVLLKGARTVVAANRHPLAYNTTGTPGMATGGMGDVLTGICAALLARKLSPFQAGGLGSWLLGRAAELAESESSPEALCASDVIRHLGAAFDSAVAGG